MSLDVTLTRFRDGVPAPIDPDALGRALEAARAVAAGDPGNVAVAEGADGSVRITLASNSEVGTIGGSGGAFRLPELSISALEMIFRVAQAADLAIVPAASPPPPPWILTAEPQRDHLPPAASGLETVVCESVAELCALLRGGVEEWKAFREMIAGGAV